MSRIAREWGGCLPLEGSVGTPTFFDGYNVAGLNTGRSAIYAAVRSLGAARTWLPFWLCPTVRDFLLSFGVVVEEYHIDEDFQPIIDDLRPDDAVVWTNWLGMVPNSFREEVIRRFQGRLIIDNCHACFAEPEPRALCVYAFRKVAGVPHGAFLVASSPINSNVLPDEVESLEGVEYLELAKIKGSNEAYGSYLANERRIGSGYRGMNPMVQAAVCGMDWKMIRDVRGRNLAVLVKELGGFAAPYFDFDSGLPIWFPLYFESDCLRERLISRSIWVPRLWKRILSMDGVTKVESDMARWLLPLPIDQRYSEDDMRLLSAVVLDEIGKL